MKSNFHLTIPGRPVAWARPRTGRQGQFYNTASSVEHRELIQWYARSVLQGRALPLFPTGPVLVRLEFVFGKEPTTEIVVSPIAPAEMCYLGRADLDNLCKLAIEALSGIVLTDDSQVARLKAAKVRET